MIQKLLFATALLLGSQTALAQTEPFQEGTHYFNTNQAQPPSEDGSVEVTVVFSYLCNHCNVLEPYVQSWEQRKPENVKMHRLHVNFGRPHELMARGYIAAEMLGIADESHQAMMDAIWKDRRQFRNRDQLADFYAGFGVEKDRFLANFSSFAADSQLRRSERDVKLFGVTGTPSIIVNRKYRVPNTGVVWDVVDYLVARESVAP